MTDLYRDPELEELVSSLNREGGPGGAPVEQERSSLLEPVAAAPARREVSPDDALALWLGRMLRRGASDLLLIAGARPALRRNGRLEPAREEPCDSEEIAQLFAPYLDAARRAALASAGAVDFSLRMAADGERPAGRFRVNLHRQRGELAAAVRALPAEIPTLAELHLPATLADLTERASGLVLVCGPTGAGKSSTLAALVGEINRSRSCHILTIEEPVEFEHPNRLAVVEQIEVGVDSPSFAAALKAALRQDPDVILVGEMRDLETIAIALTAAETGHLILSSLHTADAAQAIHRMIDVFPAEKQGQVRQQLALALSAVVCQQLVPRCDREGRLPAVEVLLATYAVRHLIRQQQTQKLHHEITLGRRLGMIALEESLARLVRAGQVSEEEARMRAARPDELASLLAG